jgi:mRNA-degrading endonuclease RelE of RelBE toxin-antitoxin system
VNLEWTPSARRDLARLDRPVQARIVAAVIRFGETNQGDIVKLSGKNPPEYRLRVGGWRVRFAWNQSSGSVVVLHIFRRGQGYE